MSYRYLTSVFADQNASPRTSCASKFKKNTNYYKVLHTQGNRERKHILKLQEGVVLVPCLILDASASLFCSHRLPRHQCCYGS